MASKVTRFPNGLTNNKINTNLCELGMLDPTKYFVFFNDFKDLLDIDATNVWVLTTTEAGSGDATEVISDAANGELLITNDNADDDCDFYQSVKEVFKFVSGKKLWLKAKFKTSDATESDIIMGLQIRDTTPLAVTDGVFFQKDDGDAYLDFHVEKDSEATSATAVATLSDATYVEVGFYYNGNDAIEYFVDNVKRGTVAVDNLPDDEELTVSFGVQNGEAVAKTMTVDYILAIRER